MYFFMVLYGLNFSLKFLIPLFLYAGVYCIVDNSCLLEHNQNTIATLIIKARYESNFMTILDFFVSH